MMRKTKVKEQLEHLPEEFSLEELIERLILIEKIENGLAQSKNGQVASESELDDEIDKWFN